jgi:mannitol-1-phosphate 5-dehydrogenase
MVPLQTPEMQAGIRLRICTEAYGFLPVDGAAFIGKPPDIAGMLPFDNFSFFIQRKLFIHNMGHSICAYLGNIFGDTYIAESITRADVFVIVQNAMLESARALSKRHDVALDGILDHINDLLHRFANRALGDTCARVGADTGRKLLPGDRLVGALHCCVEQGITPAYISLGIAAAIRRHIDDNSSVQSDSLAASVLKDIAELDPASEDGMRILKFYRLILQCAGIGMLRKAAEDAAYKEGVV